MGKRTIPRPLALGLALGLIAVLAANVIYRPGLQITLISTLSILLVAAYLWWISGSPPGRKKMFRTAIEGALVLFAGVAYGVIQSVQEGWQWTDLIGVTIPLAMACGAL